ncbi:methionine--tRNA ligase, partial [Streptomyces sp. SID89]|nr:methionine--tRNA ligase [Streptomyces sp. SID89]
EHTAFLNGLGIRLAAVADSYGQDGFSLNRAAAELDGIVVDARRFAEAEARTALIAGWQDEARTAVALELAAARLLARAVTPIMPRFAARLARALGTTDLSSWPSQVELVAPGTRIDLEQQAYFEALPSDWSLAGGATT